MNLKYLVTFKTILEVGSFLGAAKKLNYTQSTITFQMQQLEQELSIRLFERIGRKMVITKAGAEMLPYVENLIKAAEQLSSYGKHCKDLGGTLELAAADTLLSYKLPGVIKAFREQAPKVQLIVKCQNCYDIRDELQSGVHDIGIHYDVGGYRDMLSVKSLGSFPLTVIAAPERDKGACDLITPGAHNGVSVISMDERGIFDRIFSEYLNDRQIVMGQTMCLGNINTLKQCVAGDLGVALVPRFAVEGEIAAGVLTELPIELECNTVSVVMSYHKNKCVTPAMELFMRLTEEAFSN